MDSEEIDKWDEESERAWREDNHDVEFALSIVSLLNEILPKNARILDAGAGIGKHIKAFRKLGYEVIGIDQSTKALEYARILNPDVTLMCMRLQDLDANGWYDLIHTCAVLQHSTHERKHTILRNFHRALKPNGYLLFAECVFPDGKESDGYSFTFNGLLTFMAENGFQHVQTIPPWPYYLWRKT